MEPKANASPPRSRNACTLHAAAAGHAVDHLAGYPRENVLYRHDILPILGKGWIRTLWASGDLMNVRVYALCSGDVVGVWVAGEVV